MCGNVIDVGTLDQVLYVLGNSLTLKRLVFLFQRYGIKRKYLCGRGLQQQLREKRLLVIIIGSSEVSNSRDREL